MVKFIQQKHYRQVRPQRETPACVFDALEGRIVFMVILQRNPVMAWELRTPGPFYMGPLAKWHEAIHRDLSNFPRNLPLDQPSRLFGYACCRDVKKVRYPGVLDLVVMPKLSWLAISVVGFSPRSGSYHSETLSLQRSIP